MMTGVSIVTLIISRKRLKINKQEKTKLGSLGIKTLFAMVDVRAHDN